MKLKDRRIVVTGAARGIGRATAELSHREGARVAWLDMRPEVQAAAHAQGGTPLVADVRDEAAIQAALATAGQAMGGIDGLVHCAGLASSVPVEQVSLAHWRDILDVVQRNLATVPMKRMGTAQEQAQAQAQAQAILFLTSDDSSFITGSALAPDGGRTRH